MRAHRHGAPLVVIRSEAVPGRSQLRLIGELDLSTIEVLNAQLAHTTERSPPSTIDLSELHFLDLIGLRALERACHADCSADTRFVGATGVVQRIIELVEMLDPQNTRARAPAHVREPAGRVPAKAPPATHLEKPSTYRSWTARRHDARDKIGTDPTART